MRQKLITLCQKSFELSLKKDNFSRWVRDQLLKEVKKNKEQWQKEWTTKNCTSCGQPTWRPTPSWCNSHDEHEVESTFFQSQPERTELWTFVRIS